MAFGRGGRDAVQGSRQRFGEGGWVWEKSTSIIPAASGQVNSTSMCTPTGGPTSQSFGVLAMAAFSLFFFFSWRHPQVGVSQHALFSLTVMTTLGEVLVSAHHSLPAVGLSKLRNCIRKLPCQIFDLAESPCAGCSGSSACAVLCGILMSACSTRQHPSAPNPRSLVQTITELFAGMTKLLYVLKTGMFSSWPYNAKWLQCTALPLASHHGEETPREGTCLRDRGQAPRGYQRHKGARSIPFSRIPAAQTSFVFPPLTITGWQLPADAGESCLCLSTSLAERVRGCSWIEVSICHLPGFMHPQTRNQWHKAQTFFVTYHQALCGARLLKAIWYLRCPDLWFPSLISRCWLPPGSKSLV